MTNFHFQLFIKERLRKHLNYNIYVNKESKSYKNMSEIILA